MKKILSLFDFSGNWSDPYLKAGYQVDRIDIKLGSDIFDFVAKPGSYYGVLSAPPCTDFSIIGARWWKEKDLSGLTYRSIRIVKKTLEIIRIINPEFWVIENPKGRIMQLIPELGKPSFSFQPWEYGENYSKKTYLWGNFNLPLAFFGLGIDPFYIKDWVNKQGGTNYEKAEKRSKTSKLFANAFFQVNQ